MLKKTIRRLGALAMVLAMAVSVFAVNASAVNDYGSSPVTQMTITKNVPTGTKVYAPNTTFEFEVGAGEAGLTYAGYDVIQGAASDWTMGPAVSVTKTSQAAEAATGTTTMTLNRTYTAPGIYSYKVTEKAGDYDGIDYSTDVKDVLVFVEYDKDTGTYVVKKAVVVTIATTDGKKVATVAAAKSDLTFTNEYKTHKLTVKKKVEGNLGDRSKKFNFTITITPADKVVGEKYWVVPNDGDGYEVTTVANEDRTVTATVTVELADAQSVEIYGLSPEDSYDVTEAQTEYTISYDDYKSGAMGNADKETTVTNTKEYDTPTGVIMTIAPYALMVVLAGAFAVVFLSRRNRAE